MHTLVLILNVLSGLGVIGLVLVQHGKGADMGAAFGSGSSGSLFGATGSSNFLSKSTGVLAAIFFVTCLSLNYMAGAHPQASSVADTINNTPSEIPAQTAPLTAPANPASKDIPK